MKYNSIVIRYDELGLKKKNRSFFEHKLVHNLKESIKKYATEQFNYRVIVLRGRVIIEIDEFTSKIREFVSNLIGVSSFSPAIKIPLDLAKIKDIACLLVKNELEKEEFKNKNSISFRVTTTRGNKSFELNSMELDRAVAEHVLPLFDKLTVDLTNAQLVLGIDIRESAYIFLEKFEGQRGLPVGTSSKMLSLLSGGIDSPVASYFMMRRGAKIDFINFYSPPYIGEDSKGKVIELARILNKFQIRAKVYIVNFSEIQIAIKLNCDERYRTVLYRRAMMKIASKLAYKKRYAALITGEALGQVASQTIENMISIENASEKTILRPLIAYEKLDLVNIAKKIGTYETSILPYPDSCTVFSPLKPATITKVYFCEKEEKKINYDALITKALESIEVVLI